MVSIYSKSFLFMSSQVDHSQYQFRNHIMHQDLGQEESGRLPFFLDLNSGLSGWEEKMRFRPQSNECFAKVVHSPKLQIKTRGMGKMEYLDSKSAYQKLILRKKISVRILFSLVTNGYRHNLNLSHYNADTSFLQTLQYFLDIPENQECPFHISYFIWVCAASYMFYS